MPQRSDHIGRLRPRKAETLAMPSGGSGRKRRRRPYRKFVVCAPHLRPDLGVRVGERQELEPLGGTVFPVRRFVLRGHLLAMAARRSCLIGQRSCTNPIAAWRDHKSFIKASPAIHKPHL
jgi:hypothetical protein